MSQHLFGDRILELMKPHETQMEFGERVGVNRNTIASYTRIKDKMPDTEIILKISRSCNVSADWLLGLSEIRSPDISAQAVGKYTGLDGDTIEKLHSLSSETDEAAAIRWLFNRISTTEPGAALAYSLYVYCKMIDNTLYVADKTNPKIGFPITDQMRLSVVLPESENGIGLVPVPPEIIDRAMLDSINNWIITLKKREGENPNGNH